MEEDGFIWWEKRVRAAFRLYDILRIDHFRGFAENLTGEAKARMLRECLREGAQSQTMALIELAMRSRANLAVIPMQDHLRLTNEQGRMNIPSVAEGNWTWRIRRGWYTKCLARRVREMTEKTKRATK